MKIRAWRSLVVASAAVAMLLGPAGVASAAHLVQKDQKVDKNTSSPATVTGPDGQVLCQGRSTQDVTVSVDSTGEHVLIDATQTADAIGQDPTCNLSEDAELLATIILTVVPDAGERIGDEVFFCYGASFTATAESISGAPDAPSTEADPPPSYTAHVTIGGVPITDPARISESPSNLTVFSFGPTTVMNDRLANHFGNEFIVKVGDDIDIELGLESLAAGVGIGRAHADDTTRLTVDVGRCPAPAPAMSRPGLGMLGALLAAAGPLCLWRMRRRVARSQ
jgi:hypothetical protein